MISRQKSRIIVTSCLCLVVLCSAGAPSAEQGGVYKLTPDEHGQVLTTPDGRTVLRYMTKVPTGTDFTGQSVCCFYPVNTPSGVCVVDFAPSDHPYHRGVFLGWHTMKCGDTPADFWGWGEMAPKEGRVIRNRAVKLVKADANHAEVEVRNDWVLVDETVITEELLVEVRETEGVFVIDLAYHFGLLTDVTLNQTAFGGFVVRGRKSDKAVYTSPKGEVTLPPPHYLKPETNWPSEDWYDYTIPLEEGKSVGVTVVNHPRNPRTTWHNLKAIAMVNPCIAAPKAVSAQQGVSPVLRYRLVVHDGPPPTQLLNSLAESFGAE